MELHLHLAPSYRLLNGALQPIGKEKDESVALNFDRRKTVGELRLAIYQVINGIKVFIVCGKRCKKSEPF